VFEIGPSLREARARQGLTIDAMEQRTKVRAKYLRFLEDERFYLLPGDTYTKGFLKVYANELGLDGQLYVDEYNSRFASGDDEVQFRARRVQPARHRRQQRRESRLVAIGVGVILIVTGLVIAAWRFGGVESPSVNGIENRDGKRAPAANARLPQRVTLEIAAVKGPSYVEVWRGSRAGTQLYAGTLERGQVQRFTERKLFVMAAKPRRVVVKINGSRHAQFDGELDVAAAAAVRG